MNETNLTPKRPAAPSSWTALLPGLIVILLGIVFLLSSIGVLHTPIWQFWRLWPVFLILVGAVNMLRRQLPSFLWGLATAVYGVGFLLDNFGRLPFPAWKLWPVFIVALGAQLLLATAGGSRDEWRARRAAHRAAWRQHGFTPVVSVGQAQPLHLVAIFSEAHGRVTSSDFIRGEAFAMFGKCLIDLRSIGIPDHPVTIDASAIFGAVEIYIPSTWDVMMRGIAFLGAYQDETLQHVPGGGGEAKRGLLIVQGLCSLAAVIVKN